jgi:hypothetical protein
METQEISNNTNNTEIASEMECQIEFTDEIKEWIDNTIKSCETDVTKIRDNFFTTFPQLKDNLTFGLASKIDYYYNCVEGEYWMEAYSNPKSNDILNMFGNDYYVKNSGIFTFSIYNDSDED